MYDDLFRFELLSDKYSIHSFSCGDEAIDSYLHDEALEDMKRSVARTFVEIDGSKPATENVAGFFTLRADSHRVQETIFEDWMDNIGDEDKTYYETIDVPLIELMWLARGLPWRGMGVGDLLMIDALKIVKTAADCVGLIGLHLRTTPQGKRLYERYDFERFTQHPLDDESRYFLQIKTIRDIVEQIP